VTLDGTSYLKMGNDLFPYWYDDSTKDWSQIDSNMNYIGPFSNWQIRSNKDVYRQTNGSWIQVPGKANDIAIGPCGTTYIISDTDNGYKGKLIQRLSYNGEFENVE